MWCGLVGQQICRCRWLRRPYQEPRKHHLCIEVQDSTASSSGVAEVELCDAPKSITPVPNSHCRENPPQIRHLLLCKRKSEWNEFQPELRCKLRKEAQHCTIDQVKWTRESGFQDPPWWPHRKVGRVLHLNYARLRHQSSQYYCRCKEDKISCRHLQMDLSSSQDFHCAAWY